MPTALELSREAWRRYPGEPVRAPARLSDAERRERERLMRRIREAVAALKADRRASRPALRAHAAWFTSDSNGDFAGEGSRGEDYWRSWRLVEDIIADRSIDLIDMKKAPRVPPASR